MLLRRVWPAFPRTLAAGLMVLPALLAVRLIPAHLPNVLALLLPWRTAVSLFCGVWLLILARKEAKR